LKGVRLPLLPSRRRPLAKATGEREKERRREGRWMDGHLCRPRQVQLLLKGQSGVIMNINDFNIFDKAIATKRL
jgi:hypothetical protein